MVTFSAAMAVAAAISLRHSRALGAVFSLGWRNTEPMTCLQAFCWLMCAIAAYGFPAQAHHKSQTYNSVSGAP